MEERWNRERMLDLILSLSGPIGPEVFAGFGSSLEEKRLEWSKDPLTHVRETENFINEWAGQVDSDEALKLLLDIVRNPPGKEFCNDFHSRFRDEWDAVLIDLIAALARRNPENSLKEIKSLGEDPDLQSFVTLMLEAIEESRSD